MKTLHRNKRKLYICEVYQDGNIRKYKAAKKLMENWEVLSTTSDMQSIGLEAYDYIRIKTSVEHAQYYHLGDRAYINVSVPEDDTLCKKADYEVTKDPIVTLNECEVLLKKLSGRDGKNIF